MSDLTFKVKVNVHAVEGLDKDSIAYKELVKKFKKNLEELHMVQAGINFDVVAVDVE